MTFWLVRHAQPLLAPGVCYGQLNVAADSEATQDCAKALTKVLPAQTRVICSPLQRCEQLAIDLIGLRPDLTLKVDPRLREMNFGEWEGRAWNDIAPSELDAWTQNFADYRVGQRGESVTQFMARVALAFDGVPATGDTLWITHAGVIRAAQQLAHGVRRIDRAGQWPVDAPAYGQWCKLTLPPNVFPSQS